jgi:hypothetical protein
MLSRAQKAAASINEARYCGSGDIDAVDRFMREHLTDDEYLAAWATVFVRTEESLNADIHQRWQEAGVTYGQTSTVSRRVGWSILPRADA